MRSVAELRRLMETRVEKGETGAVRIEAVLARLQAQNYLNDEQFAATYTRLRQEGAHFGRRRVQQDLARKGIEAAYAEVNEEELARQVLARKRIRQPANEKESARVMRRLIGSGFSMATVGKILRRWNVGDALGEELPGNDAADLMHEL